MYTYFIVEADSDGYRIKIGFSRNPQKRIKELQTGNPRKLAIMGWIKSETSHLEKQLHLKYKNDHVEGEWFSIEPWDVLEELKSHGSNSFICIQANAGEFLGCDTDAIPEYLGPWHWLETELEDFCPKCGWGGGVHFNDALGIENCLNCGYMISDDDFNEVE